MASLRPQARYPNRPIKNILILEYLAGEATGAMYVTARMDDDETAMTRFVDISGQSDFGWIARQVAKRAYGFSMPGRTISADEIDDYLVDGTYVIIVRYITRKWCNILAQNADRLAGVAFLLDDLYDEILTDRTVPWRHKLEMLYLYFQHVRKLSKLCSELWVSTPKLLDHYRAPGVRLVEASFIPPVTLQRKDPLVIFYHCDIANHQAEVEWLVAIVRKVQELHAGTIFEISGDQRVAQEYRTIDRVRIVNRVSWSSYLAYASTGHFDIGLAPLLDTKFNQGRSTAKFFDITRTGAAGIYSNVPPYRDTIRNGIDGLLVDNKPDHWISAISQLVDDADRRKSIANAAGETCQAHVSVEKGLVRFIDDGRPG